MRKIITIFGSGECEAGTAEYKQAELLGQLLAQNNFVCLTGGYAGIMEAVAKGATSAGGECVGITARQDKERVANMYISEQVVVDNYTDRLLALVEGGSAYIVLSGGTGTLLELAAVWALREREILSKPILCIGDQWRQTLEIMGFYSESTLEAMKLLTFVKSPQEAVEALTKAFSAQ